MARCSGIKGNGERCRGVAVRGSEWCPAHHPDYQKQRQQGARRGGKRGGRGRPQAELTDLKARLSDLADDVIEGRVDRGKAAVAGQLLNTVIRAVAVELKVREQLEFEARLTEIEAALDAQDGRKSA